MCIEYIYFIQIVVSAGLLSVVHSLDLILDNCDGNDVKISLPFANIFVIEWITCSDFNRFQYHRKRHLLLWSNDLKISIWAISLGWWRGAFTRLLKRFRLTTLNYYTKARIHPVQWRLVRIIKASNNFIYLEFSIGVAYTICYINVLFDLHLIFNIFSKAASEFEFPYKTVNFDCKSRFSIF